MLNEPYFSVVIPTYNRAHIILNTLLSVLNQDFSDFEIIVVDDGSTDQTSEVVQNIQDRRTRYLYQENKERGAARNHGIKQAKGKYITFLDSDDLVYPNYLSTAYQYILKNSETAFLHTGYETISDNGDIISRVNNRNGDLNDQLIYGNSLSCIGTFIKKEVLSLYPFSEDRELSGSEDYELWMRLACRFSIQYTNQVTAALIQHQERSVINFNPEKLTNRIRLSIAYTLSDDEFHKKFGHKKSVFISHRYLYLALHLIMGKEYWSGIYYWLEAVGIYPPVLFSRKTLGIFKNIILKH